MTTIKADAKKDCHGIGCPMNMVHAKVGLAALVSGQVLELILDDGPPINNVPKSVEKEGHAILSKTKLADGAWQLMIRKV
jgi:sulfite reductase (ferredoxin)